MPTYLAGQAAPAFHPCRPLSKRRRAIGRYRKLKRPGGARPCNQAERQSTYAPARAGFGSLVGLLSRFHRRVKYVPSFDVLDQAFLQLSSLGWARLRRSRPLGRGADTILRSGIRPIALLMEYLAVSERRAPSSTELESLHPAV